MQLAKWTKIKNYATLLYIGLCIISHAVMLLRSVTVGGGGAILLEGLTILGVVALSHTFDTMKYFEAIVKSVSLHSITPEQYKEISKQQAAAKRQASEDKDEGS